MRPTNEFMDLAALHPVAKWHLRQAAKKKLEEQKKREPKIMAGWGPADWAAIRREVQKIQRPR